MSCVAPRAVHRWQGVPGCAEPRAAAPCARQSCVKPLEGLLLCTVIGCGRGACAELCCARRRPPASPVPNPLPGPPPRHSQPRAASEGQAAEAPERSRQSGRSEAPGNAGEGPSMRVQVRGSFSNLLRSEAHGRRPRRCSPSAPCILRDEGMPSPDTMCNACCSPWQDKLGKCQNEGVGLAVHVQVPCSFCRPACRARCCNHSCAWPPVTGLNPGP